MALPITAADQHARHPKPMSAEIQFDEKNNEWFALCPYCLEPTNGSIEKPGIYACDCGNNFEVYALEPIEG